MGLCRYRHGGRKRETDTTQRGGRERTRPFFLSEAGKDQGNIRKLRMFEPSSNRDKSSV